MALILAYMYIERDKDRFDKPHFCSYDGLEFGTEIELDLHMFQEHNQEPVNDRTMIERYAMLKPFLEKGLMLRGAVIDAPIKTDLSKHTIYKWMLVYKKEGIKGLARKQRIKEKRSKRFPTSVYQILENHVANFDETVMSMNQCWKKIKFKKKWIFTLYHQ